MFLLDRNWAEVLLLPLELVELPQLSFDVLDVTLQVLGRVKLGLTQLLL